jgi:hypothetical protein
VSGATKKSSLFQSTPLKKSNGGSTTISSTSSATSLAVLSETSLSNDKQNSSASSIPSISSSSSTVSSSTRNETRLSSSALEGQLETEKKRADAAELRVSISDAKTANLQAQLIEVQTALAKVTETRNLERTLHQNDDIYREQLTKEQIKAKEDVSRLVSRVAVLQNEISKLQGLSSRQVSSNTDLLKQLEQVKTRLLTVEIQASESSELKLKLAQVTEQNEKLNADLERVIEERNLSENLLASAQKKAETAVSISLSDALERLEESEKRSATHAHEIDLLKKRLHDALKVEAEVFSARKAVHHSTDVLARAHAIEAESKASIHPLSVEIADLRSANHALSRDNAALSSNEARLKMMNAEASVRVKQAEAARLEAISVSEKLRSDLLLFGSQMQTLQTELTAARLTISLTEEREAAAITLQQQTLHQAQQHLRSPKKEKDAQSSLLSPGPDMHKKMNAALDPPSPPPSNNLVPVPGTPSSERGVETSSTKSAASRFPSLAALANVPPPVSSSSSYAPPTIPAGLTTPSRSKNSTAKPSLSAISTPGGSNSSSSSATAAHNATVAALQRASAMVSDTRSQLRAESDECARLRNVISCLKAKVLANRLDALGKVRAKGMLKKWAAEVKRATDRESILSLKDRAAAVVARMHARSTAQAKAASLRSAFSALLFESRKRKALVRVIASTRRRIFRRTLSHWTRGALVYEARRAVVSAATDMKDQASVIISAARNALESSRNESAKLEKALLAAHQQLRDVEGGGAAINAEVVLLRSQATERNNEVDRLTSELLTIRESLVRAELIHEGLTRDKAALTERLENEFNARADVESNLRSSTLREEALVLKMSATEATITQLRDQLLLLSTERSTLEKSKSSLNDALLSIQQETSEAKTRRDELEVQIGYRVKERDAALLAERAAAAALLDSRAETAEARAHAASANEASAALSVSIDQLKKENETLLESFHQTRLSNSRLEDRISGLLLSLGADADRLRSAKLDLQALESRCSTAEARAESLLSSLTTCQDELRVSREENRLNAQAAANEARKAAASENELKALSAQLAKAMTSDTSHIGERNSARADMLAKEAHLADSKAQIQVLENTVNKLRASIDILTKERDDARIDLNSTTSALALARSHYESAESAHSETIRLMEKRIIDESMASARRESEAKDASSQMLSLVREDTAKEIERVILSHTAEIERVQSMHAIEIASLKSEVMATASLARAEAAVRENKLIADVYEAQKLVQQIKMDTVAEIEKNNADLMKQREQLQKEREDVAETRRIAERDVAEVVAVGSESSMRIHALTARVKSLTEQRGKVDEEVYKLQLEKKELKNQLSDMQSKVDRSERDQKKAALAISQAQALKEQVMKEKDEFQKSLANATNAVSASSNTTTNEEIISLREKCVILQEKVDKLQQSQTVVSQTAVSQTSSSSSSSSSSISISTTAAPSASVKAGSSSSNTSNTAKNSPLASSGGKGLLANKLTPSSSSSSSSLINKSISEEPIASSSSSSSSTPTYAAAPIEIKPGPKPGGPKPTTSSSSSSPAASTSKASWAPNSTKEKDTSSLAAASPATGSDTKVNTPLSPGKGASPASAAGSKFSSGSTSSSSSLSSTKPSLLSSTTPKSFTSSSSPGVGGVRSFTSTGASISSKTPVTQGSSTSSTTSNSPFGSKVLKSNTSSTPSIPNSNQNLVSESTTSSTESIAVVKDDIVATALTPAAAVVISPAPTSDIAVTYSSINSTVPSTVASETVNEKQIEEVIETRKIENVEEVKSVTIDASVDPSPVSSLSLSVIEKNQEQVKSTLQVDSDAVLKMRVEEEKEEERKKQEDLIKAEEKKKIEEKDLADKALEEAKVKAVTVKEEKEKDEAAMKAKIEAEEREEKERQKLDEIKALANAEQAKVAETEVAVVVASSQVSSTSSTFQTKKESKDENENDDEEEEEEEEEESDDETDSDEEED